MTLFWSPAVEVSAGLSSGTTTFCQSSLNALTPAPTAMPSRPLRTSGWSTYALAMAGKIVEATAHPAR